ncbi:hypothetical protein AB8989_19395 [Yersinia hibernica]|uniref:Secretion system effector protein SseF n=1 Tax=Yersinia hibernica TaxID=2339259 RepID=A0ABX5R5U6_9GAMM|nr:hypothetical protein [Yersinia hibernica]QAX81035.1 hypothetical protein D5F51_01755 [Yersinia hibernica]
MSEAFSVKISPKHEAYVAHINDGHDIEKPELPYVTIFKEKAKDTELDVNKLLDTQEDISSTLMDVRVKLARKQFFINVIELAVSLASFGVSVGISICSGGLATPISVITGLNLMLSISNLACAYHNWDCASKNKDELTMGSDAMQQAVFMLAKYCDASPHSAKKIARFTSYFVRVGIVVSLGAIGALIHPVVSSSLCLLAKNYIPIFTSMLSVITAGALGLWMNHDSDKRDAVTEALTTNEKEVIEKLSKFDGYLQMLNEIDKATFPAGKMA